MTSDILSNLVQYGAVGLLAALALFAVKVMFQRETQAFDRERQRADRLETELLALNKLVREQYITTISEASRSINDANEAVANALASVRKN